VGIWKISDPTVKAALVRSTCRMSRPAPSLNSVSMPQISDITRLNRNVVA